MDFSARVARQTFHQPTNQPTNKPINLNQPTNQGARCHQVDEKAKSRNHHDHLTQNSHAADSKTQVTVSSLRRHGREIKDLFATSASLKHRYWCSLAHKSQVTGGPRPDGLWSQTITVRQF